MSKAKTSTSQSVSQVKPDYRIGDLLWCREKNGKVWWPAMVTYEPNLGVYYRVKPPHQILHYHVQYFGISAIRGWVSSKAIEPVGESMVEKELPSTGLTKKFRSEYQVALKELREATGLDYKERKLHFIFSFDSLPRSNSKKARKGSTSSNSKGSVSTKPVKHEEVSSTKDTQRRTSARIKVEGDKTGMATPTVATTSAAARQQAANREKQNGEMLSSERGGSNSRRNSESSNKRSRTSLRRTRSASERAAEQEKSHSGRNGLPCSKEEHNGVLRAGDKVGSCESPLSFELGEIVLKGVKKLRCTSPPVEAQALNLDSELNDSVVKLELCEQSQQIQTSPPQPTFYFQPAYAPLGGLPYQTAGPCMYMSVQYASLWPSATGMTAATPTLGQSPSQMYGGLNMLYLDPSTTQRQLLGGDGLQNSRMLSFPTPTPSLFPQSSYTTPTTLLAPPTVTPTISAGSMSIQSSPPPILPLSPTPIVPLSPTPIVPLSPMHPRVTSSQSSSPPPAHTEDNLCSISSAKRPRRSNVRYGSSALAHQSSEASSMDISESLKMEGRALRTSNKKPRVESVTQDTASIASGDNDIRVTDSAQAITSALLTPPTSSSEDSPSIDVEPDTKPTSSLTLSLPLSASILNSEHTASSSEDTDTCSSLKSESSRKRKRGHKSDNEDSSESNYRSGTCSICDAEDTDLLVCGGHCCGMFHLDCLGLRQPPSFRFVCDECLVSSSTCFICGKSSGEVVKCSKSRCPKLYHLSCIQGNKLFTIDGKRPRNFTCPLHVCTRCESIGGQSHVGHSNLLQCTMCPLALHKPDCYIAGCEVLNQTQMVCYQHVKISKNAQLYSHLNLNTCLDCGLTGSLFCCDVCSAAYHLECLDEPDRPAEDADSWKCPSCAVHDLPIYGSLVLCKFGVWRWWPCEVIQPTSIPDNLVPKKPGEGMFVVRFCGSQDFAWTYHGRVVPYTENFDYGAKPHRKAKAADAAFKRACEEAKQLYQSRKVAMEAKRSKPDINNNHYIKIKTNRYLVSRPPPDSESLDFLACQCTSDHPCNDDSTCVNRASHIECDSRNCPVGTLCQNQRMQKCQNAKTVPFYTGTRGWGLKTDQDLSSGDFVIEYIGEILDMEMCKDRIRRAHETNTNNFYMLTLDPGLIIDAGQKSNQARFINHSCNPNCETRKWRVKGEPRIGIFANQDIPAGSELTFDYHLDSLGNDKKKCLCGSKNCSGFLGVKSIKVVASSETSRIKAKAKKRRKPKITVKKEVKEEEMVDLHEDDCFICQDGGSLLLCERKGCSKAYHLECVGRKVFPPKSQKWECPMHYCQVCQKAATKFCSMCPVSFCQKHSVDKFVNNPETGDLLCLQFCCRLMSKGGEEESSEDTDTVCSTPVTASSESST